MLPGVKAFCDEVNRRVGGLEVLALLNCQRPCVNRRVGGLEVLNLNFVCSVAVNRRVGGLEES